MSATIPPADWAAFVDREYLADFVPAGGAALKFGVRTDGGSIGALADLLADAASRRGLLVARVDAAATRLHLADQFLFAVASQIDWADSVDRVIGTLANDAGYQAAGPGEEPLFRRLAVANDIEPEIIQMDLRRAIAARVLKDRRLSRDFRVAMTGLALARLSGGPEEQATFETITDWLTGRNRALSAVKPYQIHARISRTNARYIFESLLLWITSAGHPGLLVLLDISRLGVPRNPRDERHFYTRAGLMDAYELLRQFIDSTDRLESCLIAVLADASFLDEEPWGRGFGAYQALKARVIDEVRDAVLVNPLASLVRIADPGTPA
ncbi:MAG: DUF2791 family P-loop domain-containing protein [Chloroflexi bacterium]|nr:DUF2791 family P-loop domain-containing protein [Chloroflexota bacterium]